MAKDEAVPSEPGDGDTESSGRGGDKGPAPPPTRAAARKAAADEQKRVEARRARTASTERSKGMGSGKPGGATKAETRAGTKAGTRTKPVPKAPLGARAEEGRTVAPAKAQSRAASKTTGKAAPKATARSGNPKRAAAVTESSRYTAPVPRSMKISPWYVPAAMFTFLGLGMLVIFLNYIGFPFGDPSNIRLFIGLGLILLGIITATQYH